MSARRRGPWGAAVLMTAALAAPLRAQAPRAPLVPEVRVDVVGASPTTVQGAVGVEIPAGCYVRVGVLAGAGASWTRDESGAAGRLDVLARFLLDPFHQSRWGFSAGGGISLLAREGERVQPELLVALDLEGPRWSNGVSPSIQVGLGGGVRAGVRVEVGREWGRGECGGSVGWCTASGRFLRSEAVRVPGAGGKEKGERGGQEREPGDCFGARAGARLPSIHGSKILQGAVQRS